MVRREVQLFSLSTLDVLTGALGAVIFLFIIVPKGGASASRTAVQAALSYDTQHKQLWGLTADSLANKKIGDTLLIVIRDLNEMPQAVPCPACPNCPDCPPVAGRTKTQQSDRSEFKPQTDKPQTDKPQTDKPQTPQSDKPVYDPTKEKVIPIGLTGVEKGEYERLKQIEILPNVPCVVAFDIFWKNQIDNVDIFVRNQKGDFVSGKPSKRNNPSIGKWESGISRTKLFEKVDLRTNMEGVRQKDKIVPGTYEIYGQFKATDPKNPKSSIDIEGLFYTNDSKGNERGKRYKKTLSLSQGGTPQKMATVTVREDGTFDFNEN